MHKILSTLAISSVMIVGTAQAEQPGQGSFALTLTQLGNVGPVGLPEIASMGNIEDITYNIGYFATDDIMPYGAIRVHSGDDTAVLLRGGSRFYQLPGDTGNLRTFADGEVTFIANGADIIGIGGHLGAEYNITRNFSVSGRLGIELFDIDSDDPTVNDDSTFNLGIVSVSINFYL